MHMVVSLFFSYLSEKGNIIRRRTFFLPVIHFVPRANKFAHWCVYIITVGFQIARSVIMIVFSITLIIYLSNDFSLKFIYTLFRSVFKTA